jgi:Mg2+ and Co2+ transporter CorA
LFKEQFPLFAWKMPDDGSTKDIQVQLDEVLLGTLLTVTVLQDQLTATEDKLRSLAYRQEVGEDDNVFDSLTTFRRGLGHPYRAIKDLLTVIKPDYRFFASAVPKTEPLPQRNESLSNGNSLKVLRATNLREFLLGKIFDLQKQLDAIKEDVNDEIQVAIGAVQVHDAQIMKKQTTWTVTLTVLAAIYLPLSLVTGIFGMNITEISSEATAPSARWVVAAWAVVFTLTAGGILTYAAVRKWTDSRKKNKMKKKRKSDLEALSWRYPEADGGSNRRLKNWSRNLKQKMTITRMPKRE